ncbi:ribonucleoside-diphosphate reductase subunit alpha [Candidatus Albibeggiatoa sp. nov. NOAA]|uniref:ribonucleoside-diphosphate reductase subunit alpha n=1 Tax=Candidatus Albibeggiatoa sp. nov. NOAA TaxID=3162724 RepID=UPI0032FA075C|nr:ribonucleoside-diphosphate reductase subunit alpha [Thiotrichaceae bacterium]
METELIDAELESELQHQQGLEQSFDSNTPDWDDNALAQFKVIRRNGQLTAFDANKISAALTKAFLAVEHSQTPSSRIKQVTQQLAKQVIVGISRRLKATGKVHIEEIQDQVELALMRAGEHKVARDYVLYREQHAAKRAEQQAKAVVSMVDDDGTSQPLNEQRLRQVINEACNGLDDVDSEAIIHDSSKNLFDGISERDLNNVLIMTVRAMIEKEPNYTYVASRLLLDRLRSETLAHIDHAQHHLTAEKMGEFYPEYFKQYLEHGIKYELLSPELMSFDIERLGQALHPERDLNFTYLGLQTLYDRYFLHWQDTRFELPQAFFMRVAMGLSVKEDDREARAIEFYELLSSFSLMSSTPTLFNSGTLRPQLSSCFISTVPDDLDGIFGAIKDNALMQKWAGGIGNDWTSVRGMGSVIKGTNGRSQGVVPFLKVANDTLVSVNQGGKRRGSGCAYLEVWHIDIDEFLELRKNTGDERRRTHDMNTAAWICDLFMQRVHDAGQWSLFSPDETPDLHDLYGAEFQARYEHYEALGQQGKLNIYKQVSAVELWRKILTMLFETGHPWITFKDPCNIRSPQQHTGVVHSSNLCTEITLNTKAFSDPAQNVSEGEIAVCNLTSVNLPAHIENGVLNEDKLKRTVTTAMRMLDNVVDINYYSVPQAKNSNLQHRPVGLGIMGFQDSLYKMRIPYSSQEAVEFADEAMEFVSYYAISASSNLAQERGKYPSFDGSLWSQGVLPIDSVQRLKAERGNNDLKLNTGARLNWHSLRDKVKTQGMRNSNTMAIAPTATISNICGVSQSIEPTYQNLFIKTNLSGSFAVINQYLVQDLKALGLWDDVMVNDLKYYDGSVQDIERIPDNLKELYATAFEIAPEWLVECASRRQKWIDQSQSLNLYMKETSGRKLDALYKLAWIRGLKTTYYLRTMGATRVQKTTVQATAAIPSPIPEAPKACAIDDPDCEACQ